MTITTTMTTTTNQCTNAALTQQNKPVENNVSADTDVVVLDIFSASKKNTNNNQCINDDAMKQPNNSVSVGINSDDNRRTTVDSTMLHDKLEQEDLTFVFDKIKHKLNKIHRRDNTVSVWSEERCSKALAGYIAFHKQDATIRVVDDYDVKDVWMTHMLFTREYAGFCDRIFGTFIHCNLQYPQLFGTQIVDHLKNTTTVLMDNNNDMDINMDNNMDDDDNEAESRQDRRRLTSQERVASLNMDALFVRMKHQFPKWSLEKHENVMNEYKRYLILILKHGNVAPSSDVDEVWHVHIWTSNKYASDCLTVLRRKFIHHAPEKKPGPKSRSAKSFQNTLVKYKAVFGETAPIEIWGGKTDRKTDRARCDLLPDHLASCQRSCDPEKLQFILTDADCGWSCDTSAGCDPWTPSCAECCGTLHKQATSTLVDCYEGCTPCFPGKEGNDWNKANDEEGCNHRCAVDCNDVERG